MKRIDRGPGASAPTGPTRIPPRRAWMWFAIALLLNFVLARYLLPGGASPITIPYTFFKEEVGKGNVAAIYSRGETMTGRFRAAVTYPLPSEAGAPAAKAPLRREPGVPRQGPPRTGATFETTVPSFVGPGSSSS